MDIFTADLLPVTLAFAYVFFWLGLLEFIGKMDYVSKSNARKMLHIVLGNILFILPLFSNKALATFIPFTFIPVNYLMSPLSPIKKLQMDTFEAGHSWGTILYAVSLTVVVWFGFNHPYFLIVAFFPLCYGDGGAALIGSNFKSQTFELYSGKKSLLGNWSFIWASFLSIIGGLYIYKAMGLLTIRIEVIFVSAIIFAVLGVIIELLSPKGMDNLFIPIISLVVAMVGETTIINLASNLNVNTFMWGFLIAGLFAVVGIVGKFLTMDGALAGYFIGIIIMGVGAWTLGAGLLTFFIVGSLATKLNKKSQKEVSFEKSSSKRDSMQALAKAGFASFVAFLILVYPGDLTIEIIVIAALGSSLADTMGTEIGIFSKSTPRYVLKPWQKLKKGESGAISIIGTLASLISAFFYTVFLFALSLIDPSLHKSFPLSFLALIPIAAVIGMLLDSILGIKLQEQRICQVCGSKVETKTHCEMETNKYSGFSFINNDLVNFIATSLGGIVAGLLFII